MFIVSKRNFVVQRADGSLYNIRKDFIGDVPEDVTQSRLFQDALACGLIAAPTSRKDAALEATDKDAEETADLEDAGKASKKKK